MRDHKYAVARIYATAIPSVRPSVCLSVSITCVLIKTAERIIKIIHYLIGPSF